MGCGSKGDDGATGPAGAAGAPGTAGAAGLAGAPGAPGTGGTTTLSDGGVIAVGPAVNGISPSTGLLGRELDVIVSGDGTSFDASSTLDFGAGITVTNVTVVSRAALSAHLSIAVGATVGPHDVVVGGGSGGTAHGAFMVHPSLLVTPRSGTLAAGGVGKVSFATTPGEVFGPSFLQGGILGGFGAPDGLEDPLLARTIAGDQFGALVLVDPVAPTGGGQVVIAETSPLADGGPAVRTLYASDPAALSVTATPAMTVTLPTVVTATIPVIGAATYKMTTTGTGILAITINSSVEPYVTFFGPSGKAIDQIVGAYPDPATVLPFTDAATRDTYASLSSFQSAAPLAVNPGLSFTAAPVTAEQTTTHPCTAPQAVTLPAIITGDLDSFEPADCFSFTTTVGAKIGYSFLRTGTVVPSTTPNVALTACSGNGTGSKDKSIYELDTANATTCKFSVEATGPTEVYTDYVLTVRAIQ